MQPKKEQADFEINESNEIIGYKVALDIKSHCPCILTLQLFPDSRIVIPITSRNSKCRTNKAMVIGAYKIMENKNGQKLIPYGKQGFRFVSIYATNHRAKYILGEKVRSDLFDDDVLAECTHGIHFFPTKEQALNYFNFQEIRNRGNILFY